MKDIDKNKNLVVVGIAAIILLSVISIKVPYDLFKSISELEQKNKSLEVELESLSDDLKSVNNQIYDVRTEKKQVANNLNETISEIEKLQSGNRYEMHDPTYWEVQHFILNDRTSEKPYDEETFHCGHYSMEVNNIAESKGMRCALVLVEFLQGDGHALIAFNVTNMGIIYYEPQVDKKANLRTGVDYWGDCVPAPPGYYYEPELFNHIVGFELYW